jgi:hypothetical protein
VVAVAVRISACGHPPLATGPGRPREAYCVTSMASERSWEAPASRPSSRVGQAASSSNVPFPPPCTGSVKMRQKQRVGSCNACDALPSNAHHMLRISHMDMVPAGQRCWTLRICQKSRISSPSSRRPPDRPDIARCDILAAAGATWSREIARWRHRRGHNCDGGLTNLCGRLSREIWLK